MNGIRDMSARQIEAMTTLMVAADPNPRANLDARPLSAGLQHI
jgi:hypothetical protein